ncbi:MAG: cobalamin-binding protein [Candidatus Binatales bacterium]
MPMHRVVTLLPSATEIVAALGFAGQIVGRSHECDYPAEIADHAVCTAPRFKVEGSSAEIDRRVNAIVRDALSVYSVDAAMLKRLNPDLIVTQSQCEVCAVSERDVEDALADWLGARPQIVSLKPNALSDIWDDIERVAIALGAPERGADLTRRLKARVSAIADRSAQITAAQISSRPAVACIEWIDPLMAAGNWMPELVAMAGGRNILGEAGKHSPRITFDELRAANPDAIVISPCGFKIDRTMAELPALIGRPGWADLKAVREGRVFVVDGNQYINRPGPRIVESLEILAELIHPSTFRFGHESSGWRRA